MSIKKRVKQFVKTFDLFAQPVTFRYGDEPSYESLTGGICSIAMVIVFVAIFTGTTINTLDKKYIYSSTTTFEEPNPSFYEVGTQSFLFAVSLEGINMNSGDRYFDIYMQFRSYDKDHRNKTYIPLQPCERAQWSAINESLGETFDRLGLDEWLCPQNGTRFELQGKYTSDQFKFYKFAVKMCNPALIPSRPCVSDSDIEDYLDSSEAFTFNFYYINTIINPGNLHYTSYYLDDLNYFPFSRATGVNANLFVSSYTVTTDESIYPFEDIVNKTGGLVTAPAQILSYEVRQDEYLKFYIRKSSLSLLVERSFRKADDTLSYIGGLFSAILALLLIMNLYNQFSYELEIAKNLYHYKKYQPLDSEGFHFFVYLGYLIYMLFDKFGISLPWRRMETYHNSLEEVRKQMDIRLIMKKILYSERMAIAVFDEHKAKILHLQEPLTLEEAEEIRTDHRLYQKLERKFKLLEIQQKQDPNTSEMKLYDFRQESQKKIIPETFNNAIQPLENDYQRKETMQMKEDSNKSSDGKEEEKTEEDKSMIKTIENIKTYINVLRKEADNGDLVSERILEKFDPKLLKKLGLDDDSKMTEISPLKKDRSKLLLPVNSGIRQRKLNDCKLPTLESPTKGVNKKISQASIPYITALEIDEEESNKEEQVKKEQVNGRDRLKNN